MLEKKFLERTEACSQPIRVSQKTFTDFSSLS